VHHLIAHRARDSWSGVGDLVFGSPSCAVYRPASIALWSLTFFVCLIELPMAMWGMYCRLFRKSSRVQAMEKFYFVIRTGMLICLGLCAILRATRPLETIGNEPVATVAFVLCNFCFLFSLTAHTLKIVRINVDLVGDPEMRARLNINYKGLFFIGPFCATYPMPIAMLFVEDYETRFKMTQGYVLSLGASAMILVGLSSVDPFFPFAPDHRHRIAGIGTFTYPSCARFEVK